MKKLLFLLFIIVFSLARENIKKYDIFIDIDKNGKLYVVEDITYDFENNKRHGIFRFIPYLRGEPKNINVIMDNINLPETKIRKNKTDVYIRIGSPNRYVTGIHKYRISYTMDRIVRKFDENLNTIRFNAVGTEWKIPIFNITIKIGLDSIFNREDTNLEVFSGRYRSTNKISYKNRGKTEYLIKVSYLPPRNGITFQLTFNKDLIKIKPEKIEEKKEFSQKWVWLFIIIYSLGLYFYWHKHGRDPKMGAVAPQYYPLEDLDVLEVGLLLDDFVDEKDISPAILELATKGYIRIENKEEKGIIFNTSKVILHKLKNPDKNLSPFLKELFFALFGNKDSFELGQQNLKVAEKLRDKIEHLKENLYQWSVEKGYMRENPEDARRIFLGLALIVWIPFVIVFTVISFNLMNGEEQAILIVNLFFIIFGTSMILKTKSVFLKYLMTAIFIVLLTLFFIYFKFLLNYPSPLVLILFIPSWIVYNHIGARTAKGIATLRYLLGFKEFIRKVESDKIRLLLKEDPKYLDKTLPYAVLFEVSEHWLKFYVDLNQNPEWFIGDNRHILHIDSTIDNGFNTTESYGESSAGGSSGGGFSGGGSGGGGGGSW